MIRHIPLALGCIAALGWLSASRRVSVLQRQVDAYCAEDWHSSTEMAEFAGRCAWFDYVSSREIPPIIEDHLAENFRAGFDQEAMMDLADFEADIDAAIAAGSLRLVERV